MRHGHAVTLYEASGQAGGRCRSYVDAKLACTIDNGNHLLLSGNQAAMRYLTDIGASQELSGPPTALFPFLDLATGQRWCLRPNGGPLPWWLLSTGRRVPDTTIWSYLSALRFATAGNERTVTDCVGEDTILFKRFWEPLAVAVLNTPAQTGAAHLLWPVFRDTFAKGEAACRPRVGRGGRRESVQAAAKRGNVDIALVRLMRDAMLRVSECAALTWSDIETVADGSGRLLIRRSKTDLDGEGAVVFVSAPTMAALASIRNGAQAELRVFELSPNQISFRIKKAALAAGLGEGFSGHSPRVGMAQDLARIGVELPSLMTAGRWRSPTMPAHYTRNETAGRGAVAQFYDYPRGRRGPSHTS